MPQGSLEKYTYTYAKETVKQIRHRHFTEAELYRPFSQLYDSVEAQTQSKRMRTWGWSLFSNGITHLIAACIADLKGKTLLSVIDLNLFYPIFAACLVIAGIVLLVISSVRQYKPTKKEDIIKKQLDQEFADDPSLIRDGAQFADSVKDQSLVMNNDIVVPQQHQPKHKADN